MKPDGVGNASGGSSVFAGGDIVGGDKVVAINETDGVNRLGRPTDRLPKRLFPTSKEEGRAPCCRSYVPLRTNLDVWTATTSSGQRVVGSFGEKPYDDPNLDWVGRGSINGRATGPSKWKVWTAWRGGLGKVGCCTSFGT